MANTPLPWTWRRPFPGDPEIWVEAVDQKGDVVVVAVLEEGNEADAKIICTTAKMYELICEALYYVDSADVAIRHDAEAEDLAKRIRAALRDS